MSGDTVVALSTPPGESGIAVVRMSGPEAVDILGRMSSVAPAWKSHTIHRVLLSDKNGEPVDEVLACVMKAPDSYTGEDVVEISCHGSMHLSGMIIEDAIARGASPAPPGEFTKRAFINGKLDLTQAEAVADLITAETDLQSRVALEHLSGTLSEKVRAIEDELLGQLALTELEIDFSDQDTQAWDPEKLKSVAEEAAGKLKSLIDSELAGRKLRGGMRITILGPRNAGKSSLYNALLGEERAIVSPVPGTTRDLLRERIHIGGFTYHLEDTAGIAETGCEIEAMGISMGRKAASEADIILFVVDGSEPWSEETGKEMEKAGENVVVILNKADLGLKVGPEVAWGRALSLSAVTGDGLEELKKRIYEKTAEEDVSRINRERIALNSRQASALRAAAGSLGSVLAELEGAMAAEIVSLELRCAIDSCGEVTGRSVAQDLLTTIFNNFCIGK